MDNNDVLVLTYGTLKSIMEECLDEGLSANGCRGDLYYDVDVEIKNGIEVFKDIKTFKDYVMEFFDKGRRK